MDRVRRLLFGLLLALGVVRVACYLVYAVAYLPLPVEVFHLEAKMVLLAYRAQVGATLYPGWRDYPHVANFFGPVYFALVGLLGAASGAGISGLFGIGRAVSFASGLLTTLLLGAILGRRYGRGAGVAGAVLSLGAAPMFGFSIMVRPDMMAELLGLGGFVLSGHRSLAGTVGAVVLLALAVLTKQTAVVFLAAAALALIAEREWRRALGVFAGCSALLIVVIVAVTALRSPNFAPSLVGESRTPWALADWLETLRRAVLTSPDVLLLPVMGLWLWSGRGGAARDSRWAVLAAVLLAGSLVLSGKKGADLNYYLSLRIPEGLAMGTLWHESRSAKGRARSLALAASAALASAALVPGTLVAAAQGIVAVNHARSLSTPAGRSFLHSYARLIERARDPSFHLLTDSGLLDLHQGERAAFGDPWLFRMLVDTGQIRPSLMLRRIDDQYYDLVVTTSDLASPERASHSFGMPAILADRALRRYAPIGREAGLFLYGRRGGAAGPAGQGPGRPPG